MYTHKQEQQGVAVWLAVLSLHHQTWVLVMMTLLTVTVKATVAAVGITAGVRLLPVVLLLLVLGYW
jgi:hypothetical protein